ncbi:MAG TPA: DUF805 domain-containing protein [Burkholderiales bacterium]|jgi:uncharacterized membrane protein YhaH (DUF805 family)
MEVVAAKPKLTTILFSDDGRLARKPYWLLGVLASSVALWAIAFVCSAIMNVDLRDRSVLGGVVLATNVVILGAAMCVWVWIFVVTTIKRLHDRGMSGWWIWIVLVPGLGWPILLIICAIAGDEGLNKYGPAPVRIT